jgi:hypothetical protein
MDFDATSAYVRATQRQEGEGLRRLAILMVVAMTALLAATAATAAPPDHFTDSVDYSGSALCTDFTNFFSGHFDVNGITTFDANGDPVMDVVHFKGSELNTRSGSTDEYTVYFDYTIVYDYATDTTTLNGMVIKVTYLGLGVLFHDVGTIVHLPGGVTVFHGPHDVWEQGQDAYCNAFLAIANGK